MWPQGCPPEMNAETLTHTRNGTTNTPILYGVDQSCLSKWYQRVRAPYYQLDEAARSPKS